MKKTYRSMLVDWRIYMGRNYPVARIKSAQCAVLKWNHIRVSLYMTQWPSFVLHV